MTHSLAETTLGKESITWSMVWKVWCGISYFGDCESYHGDRESGWTAFDAAEAGHHRNKKMAKLIVFELKLAIS